MIPQNLLGLNIIFRIVDSIPVYASKLGLARFHEIFTDHAPHDKYASEKENFYRLN